MKKALIIYCIIFVLTLLIPAIVCFSNFGSESNNELVNIFEQANLTGYYH